MATYKEKLLDPRWQKKRLKILERDDWACQICEATEETLHVHHEEYHKEPWETPDNKLRTLCAGCHAIVEYYKEFKVLGIKKYNCSIGKLYMVQCSGEEYIFWEIYNQETHKITEFAKFSPDVLTEFANYFSLPF